LAKWCVEKHGHSAGYIERLFNVMRSAFNDACVSDDWDSLVDATLPGCTHSYRYVHRQSRTQTVPRLSESLFCDIIPT
jgi:hypothetical protein